MTYWKIYLVSFVSVNNIKSAITSCHVLLSCYHQLPEQTKGDFHVHCSIDFFGTKEQPEFSYSLEQMDELAQSVIERSIAVPGVQPKLSFTMVILP